MEHDPQPLLVGLQVLGELLEVQQTVVVDVTLQDDLRKAIGGAALVASGRWERGGDTKANAAGRDGDRFFFFS